jgi:cell division protein ZapA (FtsZ GTPase activity inhibitor)
VAMMAALNLSNEVQQLRTHSTSVPAELDSRLEALNHKIEAALLD